MMATISLEDFRGHIEKMRSSIERQYEDRGGTGCGGTFGEILCWEIHENGRTFLWLAEKWGISVSLLGELIADHCRRLEPMPSVKFPPRDWQPIETAPRGQYVRVFNGAQEYDAIRRQFINPDGSTVDAEWEVRNMRMTLGTRAEVPDPIKWAPITTVPQDDDLASDADEKGT